MHILRIFENIGLYFILFGKVIAKPEKKNFYFKRIIDEIYSLGISSISIVIIISVFMGAVVALQTAYQLNNPLIPKYYIGYTTIQSMILEFSSTVVCLILAGKVGSNIASEIGTMRITEQIEALEIMGVNSASFLILPKIIAFVMFIPILVIISIIVGILGGWFAGTILTDAVNPSDYIYGLKYEFRTFYVSYSVIKAVVFAFIIASVSSFYGYNTSGGALEVGKSSTKAVVYSSILILLFNLILTRLLLIS